VIAQDLSARFPELVSVERALFEQRATSLRDELSTLETALDIAREEADLVKKLEATGDANASERLKVRRAVNDAEAAIINRRNEFAEQAQSDLSKVEDEIAQTSQVRARQLQELEASVFTALVPGIVKNIAVTTIGGVVRSGEEIMQIVPVDDDLVLETRITPADISRVRPGLPANIRLDPFDYTIFGALPGVVTYVSADTMKEETNRGEEIYYRVHVRPTSDTTGTGLHLEILPGMTAQVDIRAGDRSLFDYLMKPLRKVMTEALREK
jgi:adhesin transport system membrane fusion protein